MKKNEKKSLGEENEKNMEKVWEKWKTSRSLAHMPHHLLEHSVFHVGTVVEAHLHGRHGRPRHPVHQRQVGLHRARRAGLGEGVTLCACNLCLGLECGTQVEEVCLGVVWFGFSILKVKKGEQGSIEHTQKSPSPQKIN